MQEVKGVLLCGGEGTRLKPLTYSVNKHLVRVGELPMVEYPLRKMIQAGIKNIHVVVGGENYPAVVKYLGSGARWNVRITYSIQDRSGGIAEALGMAEPFIKNDKMLVILGDNIFEQDLTSEVNRFCSATDEKQAVLFYRSSETPERFGVLKSEEKDGYSQRFTDIIEKPKTFISNLIVVGIYFYTPDVFDIIKTLKPSDRNELEITDVNRLYIKFGLARVIPLSGNWTDCGTFDSLKRAEEQVKEFNHGEI
jgi:glucose-1-phosphate thymidylyltransferase